MNLLSHSFVRKRVISLATTLSVGATSLALAHGPMPKHRLHDFIQPVRYVADRPDYSGEAPFLAENDAAMNKMMADMAVKPTGDVDRDFVAMMVPHHQGAIDMARPNCATATTSSFGGSRRKSSSPSSRRSRRCGSRSASSCRLRSPHRRKPASSRRHASHEHVSRR